jgi:uncharacterized protein (TIGR01777 family)
MTMHVAVTGAAGLLGSALVPLLRQEGHHVTRLVRTAATADDEAPWDPAGGRLDADLLRPVDAVIHLAGETLEGKWDEDKRRRIRSSRVDGVRLLADRLAGLGDAGRRTLITASAIGFYGDRDAEELTEDSSRGAGFLADVCADVEAAAAAAGDGVRVVALRIGIVQSPRAGMLRAQLPAFRRGLGARLGLGRRYLSWIALDDLARVFAHALTTPLAGPVNAVAPNAVTNAEYTRTLGRVVGRPALLAIPPVLPRLALGDFAREVLLQSARVRPAALEASGFAFRYPRLDGALRHLVT